MKKAIVLLLALMLMSVAAHAEDVSFAQFEKTEWSFSSGAGAWSTDLRIAKDGSFIGEFHDSEMGETGEAYPDGTIYACSFSGQMSLGKQVDEHSWEIRIDKLTPDETPGQEIIEDGMRMITAEPYGLTEGDVMRLYLPGTPVEKLTEEMRMWSHLYDLEEAPTALNSWFLYSEKNDSGFVGCEMEDFVQLANPWKTVTAEQLEQLAGLPFGVPEGAENLVYRWMEKSSLAEMQFTLDGDEFCARVKPAALKAGEIENISGIYFFWDHEEAVKVGYCEGTLSLAKAGSEDWVELCQWYDVAPGLMYSLSVYTTDPDGLDLKAVAETVFVPAQGDV